MIYFEWNVKDFGQVMAVPAIYTTSDLTALQENHLQLITISPVLHLDYQIAT